MTGEELFFLSNKISMLSFRTTLTLSFDWDHLHQEQHKYWCGMAEALNAHYSTAAVDDYLIGHYPSALSPIKPLPKNTSWNQFYQEDQGFNVEKILELYTKKCYSKEKILSYFPRLSWDKLEEILANI